MGWGIWHSIHMEDNLEVGPGDRTHIRLGSKHWTVSPGLHSLFKLVSEFKDVCSVYWVNSSMSILPPILPHNTLCSSMQFLFCFHVMNLYVYTKHEPKIRENVSFCLFEAGITHLIWLFPVLFIILQKTRCGSSLWPGLLCAFIPYSFPIFWT